MHTRLFAVMATVGLVLFALGPGAATVAAGSAGNDSLDESDSQADAEPNVTVTDNETVVFGDRVSSFVQSLLSNNTTGIGQQVAQFATENNPGNAPEWAGPPEDGDRGPPEHAGQNDSDKRGGPPEHAGQNDNETAENDSNKAGGPPADAGPSDDNETVETDETEDDDSDDADDEDDSGGPPEQARGNGN